MKKYYDKLFNFVEYFDEKTGVLVRSNILDENDIQTNNEPRFRSFPDLIDVGIMGNCSSRNLCKNNGVDCYQGNVSIENMPLSTFMNIIDQAKGKTFQIALGGKGDPNKHEQFKELVKYAKQNEVVVNLTTSGYLLTIEEVEIIKEYCGAVAVSLYSKLYRDNGSYLERNSTWIEAVELLTERNVKTNIHYVVSNDSIDDLILRIKNNLFPSSINSIVLLLYKAVGLASESKRIKENDPRISELLNVITQNQNKFNFGFDSCFIPIILNNSSNILENSVDYCEAGRFSCYINCENILYPCSFTQINEFGINLNNATIQEAWFDKRIRKFCTESQCKTGKCPLLLNCLK